SPGNPAIVTLSMQFRVVWYEDNDPALRDFVRHHTIVLPAREAAKASEPAILKLPDPARKAFPGVPVSSVYKVRLPSGHVGIVAFFRGDAAYVDTVNGRHAIKTRYLEHYVPVDYEWNRGEVDATDDAKPQARLVSFYDVHEHWDKAAQAWDDP